MPDAVGVDGLGAVQEVGDGQRVEHGTSGCSSGLSQPRADSLRRARGRRRRLGVRQRNWRVVRRNQRRVCALVGHAEPARDGWEAALSRLGQRQHLADPARPPGQQGRGRSGTSPRPGGPGAGASRPRPGRLATRPPPSGSSSTVPTGRRPRRRGGPAPTGRAAPAAAASRSVPAREPGRRPSTSCSAAVAAVQPPHHGEQVRRTAASERSGRNARSPSATGPA